MFFWRLGVGLSPEKPEVVFFAFLIFFISSFFSCPGWWWCNQVIGCIPPLLCFFPVLFLRWNRMCNKKVVSFFYFFYFYHLFTPWLVKERHLVDVFTLVFMSTQSRNTFRRWACVIFKCVGLLFSQFIFWRRFPSFVRSEWCLCSRGWGLAMGGVHVTLWTFLITSLATALDTAIGFVTNGQMNKRMDGWGRTKGKNAQLCQ